MKTQQRSFRCPRAWSQLILFSLVLPVLMPGCINPLQAAGTIEITQLGFYEGNSKDKPPAWGDPRLATSFDKEKVRYIFTLIRLTNKTRQARARDVNLQVRYYRSDGSLFGDPGIGYHIPAGSSHVDLITGWGWNSAGKWIADNYKVEVWLDDREKIGEGFFQVKSDVARAAPSTERIEFDKIGFYEGGIEGSEIAPQEWDDPGLRNLFQQEKARYIFTLLGLRNNLWKIREQRIFIYLRYYDSKGKLFDDPVIEYTVPKDWQYAQLWNGAGWPDPGKWKRDRYRVELWLDNRRKIGEGAFTIH